MKSSRIIVLLICLVLFSCYKNNSLIGKWKIEVVGPADTLSAKENLLPFIVMNLLSSGATLEFRDGGNYKMSKNGTVAEGTFILSNDQKNLSITSNNVSENFQIVFENAVKIKLISERNKSVLYLNKE